MRKILASFCRTKAQDRSLAPCNVNSMQQAFVLSGLVVFGISCLGDSANPRSSHLPVDSVRAKRFEVVNDDGVSVVRLQVNDNGFGEMVFQASPASTVGEVSIQGGPDGYSLRFGQEPFGLTITASSVTLTRAGHYCWGLASGPNGGDLTVVNSLNKYAARIGCDEAGNGFVRVHAGEESRLFSVE